MSATNPSGMAVNKGKALEQIRWDKLKEALGSAACSNVIFVILLTRANDALGMYGELVAEYVNLQLFTTEPADLGFSMKRVSYSTRPTSPGASSPSNSRPSSSLPRNNDGTSGGRFRMVKVDVSQSPEVVEELGLKSLPSFVMMNCGNLYYSGFLGGKRLVERSVNRRVMLIEADFNDQMAIEKTLKRENCDVCLCLSVQQAVERAQRLDASSHDVYDIVMISDDIQSPDLSALAQRFVPFTRTKNTIICGLVKFRRTAGNRGVSWTDRCTEDVTLTLQPALARVASMAVQKPLRGSSVARLLSLAVPLDSKTSSSTLYGLTATSLLEKIKEVSDRAVPTPNTFARSVAGAGVTASRPGISGSLAGTSRQPDSGYVGINLTAEDVVIRGTDLVRKVNAGANHSGNRMLLS